MPAKIWQVEDIRNHLLAVQIGISATPPQSRPEQYQAYCQGSKKALTYLATKFGVQLKNDPAPARLKTWSRTEIEQILNVAWTVLQDKTDSPAQPRAEATAFHKGVEDTLRYLGLTFNIKNIRFASSSQI